MEAPRISAVTIGAAPRADLTAALRAALPEAVVEEFGALDDLPSGESPPIPKPGSYPLTTRTSDGRLVVADEAWLAPRVQGAIDRGEAADADLTLLLCAGGFASVHGSRLLIRPFEAAAARLAAIGVRRLGVLVPIEGQVAASREKWAAAGFVADVHVGLPGDAGRFLAMTDRPDAVVLDYVGHSPAEVAGGTEAASPLPVFDLLSIAIESVAATMRR